jgi:hypothetical protein
MLDYGIIEQSICKKYDITKEDIDAAFTLMEWRTCASTTHYDVELALLLNIKLGEATDLRLAKALRTSK